MKFFASVSALVALATSVVAQTSDFDAINVPAKVTAGETVTINWSIGNAKYDTPATIVSIILIGGETQGTLQPLGNLATGIKNSDLTYTWNVDAALGDKALYGVKIVLESDPEGIYQFSNPFTIAESANKPTSVTTTVSKSYGVKTITLSSASSSSTPEPTPTSTKVHKPTIYTHPLLTPTPSASKTMITKPAPTPTDVETAPEPSVEPSSAPTVVPANAAGHLGASSVALVGAFVVAALAL